MRETMSLMQKLEEIDGCFDWNHDRTDHEHTAELAMDRIKGLEAEVKRLSNNGLECCKALKSSVKEVKRLRTALKEISRCEDSKYGLASTATTALKKEES